MEARRIAVADLECTVWSAGPESRHAVVLFPDGSDSIADFDEICVHLHNSDLRTIIVEPGAELRPTMVQTVLEQLKLPAVTVFGHGSGAELAWRAAAHAGGWFVGMVVTELVAAESGLPPVEVPTTILPATPEQTGRAAESGRSVYADFRVVAVDTDDVLRKASRELVTEIILRSNRW